MGDERNQIGILEEVSEFSLDVPIVDVDRHCTDLETRQHGLEIGRPVHEIEPDVAARLDPGICQHVRQPIGPGLEFGVGQIDSVAVHGNPVGHTIRHGFPDIGEVVGIQAHYDHSPM